MAEEKKAFFTYKGVPLVRKGNNIYFGNMYDEFTLPPNKQIVKVAEKSSLYEALDFACAWLKVS